MSTSGLFGVCHFCEQHGPRVLLVTQAYSPRPRLLELLRARAPSDCESYYWAADAEPGDTLTQSTRKATTQDTCAACSWLSQTPGFVTNDHSIHTTFATTHRPYDAGLSLSIFEIWQ